MITVRQFNIKIMSVALALTATAFIGASTFVRETPANEKSLSASDNAAPQQPGKPMADNGPDSAIITSKVKDCPDSRGYFQIALVRKAKGDTGAHQLDLVSVYARPFMNPKTKEMDSEVDLIHDLVWITEKNSKATIGGLAGPWSFDAFPVAGKTWSTITSANDIQIVVSEKKPMQKK
jgi:hypothetical protein